MRPRLGKDALIASRAGGWRMAAILTFLQDRRSYSSLLTPHYSLLRVRIENAPDHGDDILRRHIVPFNLDITV